MWKKIDPYLALTLAGLGLILTYDWYSDGHEKEALAALVVSIGAFIYCFKNQIWPDEKEPPVVNNYTQVQHILSNLKEYQDQEKALKKDQILFNSISLDNQEARLQVSENINEKQETLSNIKKAIEQAFEYISKLTIITDRLDQAKALFLEGDIPGALEILKDEAIQADYIAIQTAKQSEEERHSLRMQEIAEKAKGIAEEWKMKAVLMATQNNEEKWFDKTKMYFQKSLDILESNDTVLEYGAFLFQQNDIEEVMRLYENKFGEDYSKLNFLENIDEFSRARIENNISNIYLKVKDFSKAKVFALKSLERVKVLADHSPDEYLSIKTEAISLYAITFQSSRDYSEAGKLFLEALACSRSLSNKNMELKISIQAKILNSLAIVQKERLKLDEAVIHYTDSVRKYRLLAKKYPNKYMPILSIIQVNLANLYSNLRQNNRAKDLYLKSIEIHRNLSEQNPQRYSINLANSLYNLAYLYQQIEKYTDANILYKESVEIIRLLASDNHASFNQILSTFLNGYASCCYNSKNFSLSRSLYEEAIEIVTSLVEDNTLYLKELADLQNNLALLLRDLEKITDAESFLLKASSNYEALLSENFEFISLPYAKNLRNLSELYLAYIPNHDKSIDFAKKSLKMYIPFLNTVPEAKENYEIVLKIVARLGEDVDMIIKSIQTSSNE